MNLDQFRKQFEKVPVVEFDNNVIIKIPLPLVSVQVSTYQHAPYIKGCLDSILMQKTSFPFEILIGEDESSDGTLEICRKYAEQYPDIIRLFQHRRKNNIRVSGKPTSTFQVHYTRYKCRGKYIAFCEGDDFWSHPQKLNLQSELMENHPEYSMCGGITKVMYEGDDGNLKFSHYCKPKIMKSSYGLKDIIGSYIMHTSSFFVRNTSEHFGKWSLKSISGDTSILVLNAARGPVGFINEILSTYRVHGGGIFSSITPQLNYQNAEQTWIELNKALNFEHDKLFKKAIYDNALRYFKTCTQSGSYAAAISVWLLTFKKVDCTLKLLTFLWGFYCIQILITSSWTKMRIKLALGTRIKALINK